MNSNENLHKRLSVFEKYKEIVFLGILTTGATYLFNHIMTKLDLIDERLYRIEMNTNGLETRVAFIEDSYREIRKDIEDISSDQKKLEHRIIILEQRQAKWE